ncbi:hypothetical protein Nepgr_000652 [Nepenthes gracilis]|uniref:Cytochrome b5 heme-binding domain-containing protein n=1 Tax=Nepenthes gracilis TaxID=150966 RepID=A0AAD3P3T3_NEPGR|nr:hypothetical protein Nepgr_000652 [Nepenthes gracilis]
MFEATGFPITLFHFLLFDIYRVLRPGGLFWLDCFFGKVDQLEEINKSFIDSIGFLWLKWATRGVKLAKPGYREIDFAGIIIGGHDVIGGVDTDSCRLPLLSTKKWSFNQQNKSMEFTSQQLKQYDGSVPSRPIYVAIKGRVFDVTTGVNFYGPGGPYSMFSGKDASRALAKMSKNDEDVSPSLDGLSEKELGVLADWEKKFEAKYPVVGRVV